MNHLMRLVPLLNPGLRARWMWTAILAQMIMTINQHVVRDAGTMRVDAAARLRRLRARAGLVSTSAIETLHRTSARPAADDTPSHVAHQRFS